jgi:hypothetical protein
VSHVLGTPRSRPTGVTVRCGHCEGDAAAGPEDKPAHGKKGKGKRNVNGEGNIRQRSDGRWEGRAT